MTTTNRQVTVRRLDEIGSWIEVAAAWHSTFDTRRMIYELASMARLVVVSHNHNASHEDQISFDDDEAVWIIAMLSALRQFRPSHSLPE